MSAGAAAPGAATPQVLRDRLLQSMDGQSNIRNMIVVLEVISLLENYPITKRALEETRLGKLINDLRKKTKNESLARRAKNILRNWQKLIEPDSDEMFTKTNTCSSWSLGGDGGPCVPLSAASCKTDLGKSKEFNQFMPPNQDRTGNQKSRVDQKEGQFPVKKSKMQMPNNLLERHFDNSVGISTNSQKSQHSERGISESFTSNRHHKISNKSIQPHPAAQRYSRSLSTSALYEAPVLQQQPRQEQVASGERCRARSSPQTSQTLTQEAQVKQAAPAQEQSLSSTKLRHWYVLGSLDPPAHPSGYRVKSFGRSWSADSASQKCTTFSTGVNKDHREDSDSTGKRERQKHRSEEDGTRVDTPAVQHSTNTPRLTDTWRKTFLSHLECSPDKEVKLDHQPQPQRSNQPRPNPTVPSSPFQSTDRKRLSRSEVIQSYLGQQNDVHLTPSRDHARGEYVFMTDFFKKEVKQSQDTKTKHTLATQVPVRDLPGITREVTEEDLSRLNTQRWPGVNGCYDTKGDWYDWTQCVSVDPNGDGKKLKIRPYVCLDLM